MMTTYNDAIAAALNGKALLFTGAGFSFGSKNLLKEAPRDSRKFALFLYKEAGTADGDTDLANASSYFLKKLKDPNVLIDLLKAEYTITSISDAHKTLGAVSWLRTYTTNYDRVLETAYRAAGRGYTSISISDDVRQYARVPNSIVHINGQIDKLNVSSINSEFKLTNASYLTQAFEGNEWLYQFKYDLRSAAAVFFVGYSLYDLDVRRLIHDADISEKTFFIVAPGLNADSPKLIGLDSFGQILPIGVDQFGADIQEASKGFKPDTLRRIPQVFEIVVPIDFGGTPSFRDARVRDLLIAGDVDNDLFWRSVAGSLSEPYYISRQCKDAVVDACRHNNPLVVLTGKLGNGKTLVLDGALAELALDGWKAYVLNRLNYAAVDDIQVMMRETGQKVIAVERYRNHRDLVSTLYRMRDPQTTIILTERAELNDIHAPWLNELLKGSTPVNISVDDLSDVDIEKISSYLTRFGYWFEYAKASPTEKFNLLKKKCKGEFAEILVWLLEAPQIRARYDDLLAADEIDAEARTLIVALFLLEVIDIRPTQGLLWDFYGNKFNWTRLRSSEVLRQLIEFGSNTIHFRSSIVAQFLLKRLFTAGEVLETLTTLAERSSDAFRVSEEHRKIFRDCTKYSYLQSVVPDSGLRDGILQFYERLKTLPQAQSHPHFWLQFGIAALTLDVLPDAERHLQTAYSLADRTPGYDKYQIHNHYARLLLRKAVSGQPITEAFEGAREAKRLLFPQFDEEISRRYAYRVAQGFDQVFAKFAHEWSPSQKSFFMAIFADVLQRVVKLPAHLRASRDVHECELLFSKRVA